MVNKNSIKVILAFSGVILLGLISLVIIDSFKEENIGANNANANLTK